MKYFILSIFTMLNFSSCSDDDPQPGCYKEEGRRIIATVSNAQGTIRAPGTFCPDVYTIEPDEKADSRPLGAFDPCNLTNDFQIEDSRVIFSGYIYEAFENEDLCADFFEITSIRIVN